MSDPSPPPACIFVREISKPFNPLAHGTHGIHGRSLPAFGGAKGDQGLPAFGGAKGDQGLPAFGGAKGDQGLPACGGAKGDQGVGFWVFRVFRGQ
ncbi:MAG: hypothetical protein HY736_05995 [Verrucomicrobia bacterium]|nr:hypothetical protein [Verrucomicrobiota bacterium]